MTPATLDEGAALLRAEQTLSGKTAADDEQNDYALENWLWTHRASLIAAARQARDNAKDAGRPHIICLCGSTRFIEQFAVQTWELERQGNIVLGCTLLPGWYCDVPSHFGEKTGTKEQCDALHLRKIDMANEVLVLNYDGYIGESTRNEIAYAVRIGKPIRYIDAAITAATPGKGEG